MSAVADQFGVARPPYGGSAGGVLSPGLMRLVLAYVWISVASISVVLADPAPPDILIMGLALLLPVVGLVRYTPGLALYMMIWCLIIVGGLIATTQAGIFDVPVKHTVITLYLAFTSVVLAGFISSDPPRYIRLIMSAYLFAAVIAAIAGIMGYFGVAGTYDLFTEYGRAKGTFQDPNVFGAFLVPAILYCFNTVLRSKAPKALLTIGIAAILILGCLLSLSRGSWINLIVSMAIFSYLTFITAQQNRRRVQLLFYLLLGILFAVGLVVAVLSVPSFADLFGQRFAFEQSYDAGPEGRFGGQLRAIGVILDHPLGYGALEFARIYKKGDVHQVYLSMFLNTGWLGGVLFIGLVLGTVFLGIRRVLGGGNADGLGAVVVAGFTGAVLEGVVIDIDHWRHLFLLMAIVWGMALASPPGASAAMRRD
ncbi:O-antigen ligase family protein [Methyloligella sp. 2.7D]|uniref:O-antigen ligase family protein n=1 Tax=unclassified Methyloligella TaxID=2625955 RepID=UPI00157C1E44|nr:O-antigen ligase family protein [Methyloligella sp. GL2]QKP77585.1 hypothetical protein HT051_09085 [Methyloligella sp. GL2]